MKFWRWNNSRLVINIDNISLIRPDGISEFEICLINESHILSMEQYQSLMKFIEENDK